jgi:7-keto-8-aminopelargonate synthetase-like enzyme
MFDTFEKEAETVATPRDALTFSAWTKATSGTFLRQDKPAIDFASWDFLGSSANPKTIRAAQEELESGGFGSPIGRRWIGASPATLACEETLAKHWGVAGAILFPGINQAVFSLVLALGYEQDLFIVPDTCSGPILDVAALIGCTTIKYRSNELSKLVIPTRHFRRKFLFADSVEPSGQNGDLVLAAKTAAELGAVLFIDDSIGFGIKPHAAWFRTLDLVSQAGVVFCANFSRRFGIQGAGIGGSKAAVKLISNRSRALTGEPAFSGPNAAALNTVIASGFSEIEIVQLDKRAEEFRLSLISKKIIPQLPFTSAPIVSIPLKDIRVFHQLWTGLLERGVLADRFISLDPQAPGGYIRLFIRYCHSQAERDLALQAVLDVTKLTL